MTISQWMTRFLGWKWKTFKLRGLTPLLNFLSMSLHAGARLSCLMTLMKARSPCTQLYCWTRFFFEGPFLGRIPMLKFEDRDLADTKRFPHLATYQLIHCVVHKTTKMTSLVPWKWFKGVDKASLLNLLWVSHYNPTPITLLVIK